MALRNGRSYSDKYSYKEIKQAIRDHGYSMSGIQRALNISYSTLRQYFKQYPDLYQYYLKKKKRAPAQVYDVLMGILTPETAEEAREIYLDPVGSKYILRMMSNFCPKLFGTGQKNSGATTIGSVNILNDNRTPTLTDEKIQEIMGKSTSKPALLNKIIENSMKELEHTPPPEELKKE